MISDKLLSEIHAQFRRQMNADISQSLRQHGLNYRIAFGVPSMRLAEIARLYEPSAELAEVLWSEDIRESKMLATRLYPIEQMTPETAFRWMTEISHEEVADQACMNLFARLPYASTLCMQWTESYEEKGSYRLYCALKIVNRLGAEHFAEEERKRLLKRLQTMANDTTLPLHLRTEAFWAAENFADTEEE